MSEAVDLYNNIYADFGSRAEAAVRHHAFGEDMGQSSWITAGEWLRFADQALHATTATCSRGRQRLRWSGVYLAAARGCRVTGIDINEHGIRNGEKLAAAEGRCRSRDARGDASKPLPFPTGAFDAVLSNDAMRHLSNRLRSSPNGTACWAWRAHAVHGRHDRDRLSDTRGTCHPQLDRLGTSSPRPERMSGSSTGQGSRCCRAKM